MLLKCFSASAILTSNCWYFAFMPRYAYLSYMKVDGEWVHISEHFFSYEHAWQAMWNFAADHDPWSIIIV